MPLIHIRSEERTSSSPSSTDFTVELEQALPEGLGGGCNIKFVGCQIPYSQYNITNDNKTLTFFSNLGGSFDAVLDPGLYTIDDLTSELKSKMDTISSQTWVVAYSDFKMRLTISGATGFYLDSSSLLSTLGFTGPTSSGLSHTGSQSPKLIYPMSLFILVSELGNGVHLGNKNGFASFMVPVSYGVRGEIITLSESEDMDQKFFITRPLKTLHVKLLNPDGSTVDLNGLNWAFTLQY